MTTENGETRWQRRQQAAVARLAVALAAARAQAGADRAGPAFEQVCDEEGEFLAELASLAAACQWGRWDSTRLIYADWLLDRGDPRHAVARAAWEPGTQAVRRHGPSLRHWLVRLPQPLEVDALPPRLLRLTEPKAVNSRQLLHFAPTVLRVAGGDYEGLRGPDNRPAWLTGLRLTEMSPRRQYSHFDTGVYRAGLVALFDPESRAKEF